MSLFLLHTMYRHLHNYNYTYYYSLFILSTEFQVSCMQIKFLPKLPAGLNRTIWISRILAAGRETAINKDQLTAAVHIFKS